MYTTFSSLTVFLLSFKKIKVQIERGLFWGTAETTFYIWVFLINKE